LATSSADIRAENATFIATGSEGAVIEGRNSIKLKDCDMSGAKKCGVMIYQSFSGDAEGREGSFSMDGGSLSTTDGPPFFVNKHTRHHPSAKRESVGCVRRTGQCGRVTLWSQRLQRRPR
jgi:hypothetical protein